MALIPVIAGLEPSGIPIDALWWALVFGTGVGGNATIVGATANVVVVSVVDRTGEAVSARYWMRYGIPTMPLTTTVASGLYALLFSLMRW